MSEQVDIRRLSKDDKDILNQITNKFKEAENVNMDFFDNPMNQLIAGLHDGEVIGFALAYKLARIDTKRFMMLLYEIEVLPEHRRKGAGKMMLDEIIQLAKDEACYKLFLMTNESNVPAMTMFEIHGGVRENRDDVLITFDLDKH